jgi:uncharacterized protein
MAEAGQRKRPTALAAPLLIIMLKEPVMGRVKTRLAREIGLSAATRFARVSARATIGRLARDPRWRVLLALAPDGAARSKVWPAAWAPTGQGRGDLGARMGRLLGAGPRPAVLIGADIPAVSAPLIAEAFRLLRRADVVLGPAEDGGYWLIGAGRRARLDGLFSGVRWSSPHALADTLANLRGNRIAYAARLGDVDDAEGLRRFGAAAGRLIPPPASRGAR